MGENQKNVLIGTAVLIVAMVLYPPFVCVGRLHGGLGTVASGYGWIWDLPEYKDRWDVYVPASVNVGCSETWPATRTAGWSVVALACHAA